MSTTAYFDDYEERTVENINVLVLMDKKEDKEYQLKDTGLSETMTSTLCGTDNLCTFKIVQNNFSFELRNKIKLNRRLINIQMKLVN